MLLTVQRSDFFLAIVGKVMVYFQKLLLVPVSIVLVTAVSLYVNTGEVCLVRVEFSLNVFKWRAFHCVIISWKARSTEILGEAWKGVLSKEIRLGRSVHKVHKIRAWWLYMPMCLYLLVDMYMSYRWVSFWWKVMWQCHTESETRPSEIKSSITKTTLRHEITHDAHPATRILLYDNSHRSHSNWNEGRQYLSKISNCPSQCRAWRGTEVASI